MISTEYTHCSLGTRYTNAAQSCTKGSCPHSLRLALLVQMTLKQDKLVVVQLHWNPRSLCDKTTIKTWIKDETKTKT